jgi:hypothetical protein
MLRPISFQKISSSPPSQENIYSKFYSSFDRHIFPPTTSTILQPFASIQIQLVFNSRYDATDVGVTTTHRKLAISKSFFVFGQSMSCKHIQTCYLSSSQDLGPPKWI